MCDATQFHNVSDKDQLQMLLEKPQTFEQAVPDDKILRPKGAETGKRMPWKHVRVLGVARVPIQRALPPSFQVEEQSWGLRCGMDPQCPTGSKGVLDFELAPALWQLQHASASSAYPSWIGNCIFL